MEKKEIEWIIREKYKGKKEKLTKKDLKRLDNLEPVDYIIGFVDFINCRIDLSYNPLIPRQETEFWVEKAIREISNRESNCLDLFSGSGCIGLALLKNLKNVKVDFTDIDKSSLKQIKKNLLINKIEENRYNVFYSDIFSDIKKNYDYIFANPPYIPEKRKDSLNKSVFLFEPYNSLFGGKDGLKYIRTFLKEVKRHLKKGGVAYMEFDSSQKKEIEKIDKSAKFFKDQYNRWRYLKIKK